MRVNPVGSPGEDELWVLDIIITERMDPAKRFALELLWYERAAREGRLPPAVAMGMGFVSGTHPCRICGMYNWSVEDAQECCSNIEAGEPDIIGRYDFWMG
jgi:hypothetical protein